MKHPVWKLSALSLAMAVLCAASPAPGASDPLVTLSYLTGPYRQSVLSDVDATVAAARRELTAEFTAQAPAVAAAQPPTPEAAENDYRSAALQAGQSASLRAGGEALLLSGAAVAAGAGLVDATAGEPVAKGTALRANHLYVASAAVSIRADGGCSLLIK